MIYGMEESDLSKGTGEADQLKGEPAAEPVDEAEGGLIKCETWVLKLDANLAKQQGE
jgi:hypothetical protein